ncbi:MAG: hypothetical protein QXU18_04655 [Thermoplasmatales archaeon]
MPICLYISDNIVYAILKFSDFVKATEATSPAIGNATTDDLFFCSSWYVFTEYNNNLPYKATFLATQVKASVEHKIPILVVHEKGKRNDICILTLADFISHVKPQVVMPEITVA